MQHEEIQTKRTEDKKGTKKVKDIDTQTTHECDSRHGAIHKVFHSSPPPVYVFSASQPIRNDHILPPSSINNCCGTIPVQYVHPNFCYPSYVPYQAVLPPVLPKEQITSGPENVPLSANMSSHIGSSPGKNQSVVLGQNRNSISASPTFPGSNAAAAAHVIPAQQQHLMRTINEKGDKDKKYQCHVCKSTFALQRLLNRHMKTHSFYKRYQCPYCDKGFNDTFDLKRHVRTHTGIKPFKCNLCDKAFTQRCSLEAHTTRVHGVIYQYGFRERRAKLYVCEDCGETFQESNAYVEHLQERHPEAATKTRYKRSLMTKVGKTRRPELNGN